jgi:hypothetical protein
LIDRARSCAWTLLGPVCALMGVACGGGNAEPPPIVNGSGGQGGVGAGGGDAGGATGGAGAGPSCPAPEPAPLGQVLLVETLHASLIDQEGTPAENVQCTSCGTNLCSGPAMSDAQGEVTVTGPGAEQHDARFNVGYNGLGYAKMAALIPTTPSHDFGIVRVVRLPPFSEGAPLLPGQDATSQGVTITPSTDAVIDFDDILFSDEAQHVFIAALVDIRGVDPAELPFVDPALGLEVLIGTGALDTHICPAAELRFENVAGWPAGTDVDIVMNGTKTFQNYAPYGQWAVVAEAVVDSGGATVTTKTGTGIESLGTFGARPKR